MTPHTMFKLALGFFGIFFLNFRDVLFVNIIVSDKHDFTSDKVVMIQINPPTTHMPSGAEVI